MSRNSLRAYSLTCEYPYTTAGGRVMFVKRRYELLDPLSGLRSKTFRYFDPANRSFRKPSGADRWLYRLAEVCPALKRGKTIHWAEGEKDADALAKAGVIATSHHQGAGHVTVEQAMWLHRAAEIVLWVDKDKGHWEVGAYDAVLRYNLLMELDVDPDRVRFVKARRGKDAFDHLAAGFSVARAVEVDRFRLAEVARAFTPTAARSAGYHRG
jgi:DNA primase